MIILFGNLAIDIDDTATANIITDCPKNLNKATDYTYTVTVGTDYVSVNSSTGVITALKSGTTTVKATHKVMNVNYTFSVKVNKNAIIDCLETNNYKTAGIAGDAYEPVEGIHLRVVFECYENLAWDSGLFKQNDTYYIIFYTPTDNLNDGWIQNWLPINQEIVSLIP